tara:strand:+ start:24 stop:650 length:627 start_codon:yes stop_codon:yes gene_type:complete
MRITASLQRAAAAVCLSACLTGPLQLAQLLPTQPALAISEGEINYKFPPIDKKNDATRCKFLSSAMGQANAARDSLYDLRECKMDGKDAEGFDLSGALMAGGDFSKANFKEAQLSKVYAKGANFDGAVFTNGVVDRAMFDGTSLVGTIFGNCVLSGTTFEGANLENSDFTDAYLGDFDQRKLCKNPSLQGENPVTGAPTRASAGCRVQ